METQQGRHRLSRPAAELAARTHCNYGHPFAGENLVIKKDGTRACRECRRVRLRNAYVPHPKQPRTHCANGHPWTEESTRLNSAGFQICIPCSTIQTMRWRAKAAAKAAGLTLAEFEAQRAERAERRRQRHIRKAKRRPVSMRERLLAGLIIEWGTGCLLWENAVDRYGYGKFQVGRRTLQVHRVAWEMEHGPVSAGLELDHVYALGCRNRNCANIAHLEPVTRKENLRRMREAQRLANDNLGDRAS